MGRNNQGASNKVTLVVSNLCLAQAPSKEQRQAVYTSFHSLQPGKLGHDRLLVNIKQRASTPRMVTYTWDRLSANQWVLTTCIELGLVVGNLQVLRVGIAHHTSVLVTFPQL